MTGSGTALASLPVLNTASSISINDAMTTVVPIYAVSPIDDSLANGIATTPAAPAIRPGPEPLLLKNANLYFDVILSVSPTIPPMMMLVHIPNNGDMPTIVAYAIDVGTVANATVNPDNISVVISLLLLSLVLVVLVVVLLL